MMTVYGSIILLIVFIGVLLVVVEITRIKAGLTAKPPDVVYRFIPKTFEEEQLDSVTVTDIFETMFSQPSPWVNSVRTYDRMKQERINNYFISQL